MFQQVKRAMESVPFVRLAYRTVKSLFRPAPKFVTSTQYWDQRYRSGGNSGAGSYSRLADFKSEVINGFVHDQSIGSVIEFGVGDGNQLKLAKYESYLGFDVSESAITNCRKMFRGDKTKSFKPVKEYAGERAELVLSLDVIYHLVEDTVYQQYMRNLFGSATKYVIIYSSNDERLNVRDQVAHVRHRTFTDWIKKEAPEWSLVERIPNRYPFDAADSINTSFAEFYIFRIGGNQAEQVRMPPLRENS